MKEYTIAGYDENNNFTGCIAGLGHNKGKWDSLHSRRTAQRHAKRLREQNPNNKYKVIHYLYDSV